MALPLRGSDRSSPCQAGPELLLPVPLQLVDRDQMEHAEDPTCRTVDASLAWEASRRCHMRGSPTRR
jgi:hypothetical protein